MPSDAWPGCHSGEVGGILQAPIGSHHRPLFVTLGVLGAGVSFILYVVGLNDTPPAPPRP
ncbi:hypothetical protein [Halomonas ventosae]|uniref:hypothetical protein n=1 Tax=Halomonas ventosae TaxID=229007 RepID=UPI001C6383E9|nr:hypothetical protein [Halomonas ventosae]